MSEHHDEIPKDLPRPGAGKLIALLIIVLLIAGGLFAYGFILHEHRRDFVVNEANEQAAQPPVVEATSPKPANQTVDLNLPGDAKAMKETALYARVTGYLKSWTHDIQSHVEKDELLAEISAPDLDAQLDQAKASLDQAKSNLESASASSDLAKATLTRYQGLVQSGSVTQQQIDQYQTSANQAASAYLAAQSQVKSAQANVEQLTAQTGFEKIYAPFAGTITVRNYDIGALISPNDTAAGHEMFQIAETDVLRVYIDVPQSYATQLQPGMEAEFSVQNYQGRKFPGKVVRTAGVIDPNTRTLLTEVDFENKQGLLLAGMYGEVTLHIHREHPTLTVPTTALMFEATGTQVAVVQDGKVHFKKVGVGRDFGTTLEILTGLDGNEVVITNPGEKVIEDAEVRIAAAPAPKANATANAATQPSPNASPSNAAQSDAMAQDPSSAGSK